MVIILCECDWRLGHPLPPHQHMRLSLVEANDGRFRLWINNHIPQEGYTVLAEVEELGFNVDWKELARRETVPSVIHR